MEVGMVRSGMLAFLIMLLEVFNLEPMQVMIIISVMQILLRFQAGFKEQCMKV